MCALYGFASFLTLWGAWIKLSAVLIGWLEMFLLETGFFLVFELLSVEPSPIWSCVRTLILLSLLWPSSSEIEEYSWAICIFRSSVSMLL